MAVSKDKVVLVTPTYDARSANWSKMKEWLRGENVEWHAVRSHDDKLPCPADREWRLPDPEPHSPQRNIFYRKLNYWIDVCGREVQGWVHMTGDDELVQRGAYSQVDGGKLIVMEGRRGHATPYQGTGRHDTRPLLAHPGWMVPGSVTLGQLIVRADALRGRRFEEDREDADGVFIQQLLVDAPPRYRSDLKLYFNALEPGRWNYLEGDMDYCRVCRESALVRVDDVWFRCMGCASMTRDGKQSAFESRERPDLEQIQTWFRDWKPTVKGNDFLDVGWTDSVLDAMHNGGWAVHGYSPTARGREGCTTVAPHFSAGCFRRQFHGVLLRGVMEHVEDWGRLLQQIHSTTIHQGMTMITSSRPWTKAPTNPDALQVHSPAFMRYHLERLGYEVKDYRLYDTEQQWLLKKGN